MTYKDFRIQETYFSKKEGDGDGLKHKSICLQTTYALMILALIGIFSVNYFVQLSFLMYELPTWAWIF